MRKLSAFYVAAGSLALLLSVPYGAMAQPSPAGFPLRCLGKAGMASTSGPYLIVNFIPANGPAGEGLQPGQCAWLDRALWPNEPVRVVYDSESLVEAQKDAEDINNGKMRTFWVFTEGDFFCATASASGAQTEKPRLIDQP